MRYSILFDKIRYSFGQTNMLVPIIIASPQDQDWADKIIEGLKDFGIPYKVHVASAHKVPEKVFEIVGRYNDEKEICFITVAGRSNGLSGVVAANSVHPVIACPPFKDKLDYLVNIHSSLQMPSDTPVLTVLDPANAAAAAARILGIKDDGVRMKVKQKIRVVRKSFE